MAVIQDIQPPDKGKRQAALQQLKKFHQATIIPTPTMEPVIRAAKRVAPGAGGIVPKKGHYDSFRPHPLIQKYQARNIKPDIAPMRSGAAAPAPLKPVRNIRPDIVAPPSRGAGRPVRPDVAAPVHKPVHPARPTPPPAAAPAATRPERPYQRPLTEPTAEPAARPAVPAAPVPKRKARAKIFDFIQYPLIAAAALGAALSTTVGQILIGVFLVIAIIAKLPSKFTFIAALILLVCIPFFQILKLEGTSENAAVYAFEMLVVGTIQAMIELWRDGRAVRRTAGASSKQT